MSPTILSIPLDKAEPECLFLGREVFLIKHKVYFLEFITRNPCGFILNR